jgi:hypothetical protein
MRAFQILFAGKKEQPASAADKPAGSSIFDKFEGSGFGAARTVLLINSDRTIRQIARLENQRMI